jgi:hypothetical protein
MPGPLSHPRPSRGCCALTRRLGPPLVLRRARVCTPREQQDIALPLMIALSPPQRALTKQDRLGQAFLHRPDPALRISIQVRTARRQHERFRPDLTGYTCCVSSTRQLKRE